MKKMMMILFFALCAACNASAPPAPDITLTCAPDSSIWLELHRVDSAGMTDPNVSMYLRITGNGRDPGSQLMSYYACDSNPEHACPFNSYGIYTILMACSDGCDFVQTTLSGGMPFTETWKINLITNQADWITTRDNHFAIIPLPSCMGI